MAQQDALAAQATADLILYNAGFADGVASVGSSGSGEVTTAQEQIDIAAAVASAIAPLNTQITAMQLAKSQEDQLLASVQTAAQAVLALFPPAQTTPSS